MLITIKQTQPIKKDKYEVIEILKIKTNFFQNFLEYTIVLNTEYKVFQPTFFRIKKNNDKIIYEVIFDDIIKNNIYPNIDLLKNFDSFFNCFSEGFYNYNFEKIKTKKQFIDKFVCRIDK